MIRVNKGPSPMRDGAGLLEGRKWKYILVLQLLGGSNGKLSTLRIFIKPEVCGFSLE